MREVGLGESLDVFPGKLSGGMRQRVGVAKVFALEPGVLLLDEPFGALDQFTRQAVNRVFVDLWRRHRMTTLVVIHAIDEALFLANRIVVLGGKPTSVVGVFGVPSPQPADIVRTFSPVADAVRVEILRLLAGERVWMNTES